METLPLNQSLPPRLRAGDALTRTLQTDLAVGTTLLIVLTGVINGVPTRYMLGGGNQVVPIDSTGCAVLALLSAITAPWLPGRYDWVTFAIDSSGQRTEVAQGEVRIDPDPAGTTPADTRSYNSRMLDQIRALRAGKALDDVQIYKIGGRELTHYTHRELKELEAEYENRVRSERIRNGENVPTRNKGIAFGGRGCRF